MNDLDQLKKLLFGAEKEALDSISERVERRDIRTDDVADILPEAIHQSFGKNDELVESLSSPVGECLKREFRDDPETYGDALYPVMGPAIRKSIMHALRDFSQQINQAVEHSFSPKGLRWRWEASRAGIPFGDYVIQKTLQYRVEQAYLISRENGLLVSHVHHLASKIKDSDAVSAMFTAIQDFVKESFSPDRTGRLESADMGEFTLWAVHGPHALLVCVIRGVPPKALRADLSAVLERIHFRYGDAIREYKGDTGTVPDVDEQLERCLKYEAVAEQRKKRGGPSIVMLLLLLGLLAAVTYGGYLRWARVAQQDDLAAALAATPGIYVSSIEREGANFTVRGLVDPLAESVADVASRAGVDPQQVTIETQAFQSLQPEMLQARAEKMFAPPDSVQLEVVGTELRASGDAPWAWQEQLQNRFGSLAGIESLDRSRLVNSDLRRLAGIVDELNDTRFLFIQGNEFAPGHEADLVSYSEKLRQLLGDAGNMGRDVNVQVSGSTDLSGTVVTNSLVARRRAETAVAILAAAGIVAAIIETPPESGEIPDANLRSAMVHVQLRVPAAVE